MEEMVRCKTCGFVMPKSKLGEKCPACGVPARVFEDYDERISPRRKLILSADAHPSLVHFPQAFTFSLLIALIVVLLFPAWTSAFLGPVIRFFVYLLPLTVVLAYAAGLLDAVIRFRRLSPLILRKKMVLGVLFFLCSLLNVVLLVSRVHGWMVYVLFFTAAAAGFSIRLALLGVSLLAARFPG